MRTPIKLFVLFAGILSIIISQPASAQFDTCSPVQACVDTQIDASLASCLAAVPQCDLTKFKANQTASRFGVSAQDVADRAIELRGCATRTVRTACNACYRAAKQPLQDRFFGRIFQGLLGQAVLIIESQRKAVCEGT